MKSSTELTPGAIYSREDLIEKFGITDATINNGIFKPKGHESVWLFVTENKTPDRVQYLDHLDGDVLLLQGQSLGRTDSLIEEHVKRGLELLLFHRTAKYENPKAAFRYEGEFSYVRSFGSRPKSFVLLREDGQPRIYGIQAWRWVLAAVQGLGGSATKEEIEKFILDAVPQFNTNNTDAELQLLTVNHNSRGSHGPNTRSRRTDGYSPYDALYQDRRADGIYYELYDPAKHDVWALTPDASGKQRPTQQGESPELFEAAISAEREGAFDVKNKSDGRDKALRQIVQRRGQRKFRNNLIAAYDGKCALSGCAVVEVLEAAHITPYMGRHTNHTQNGLLLRGDLHTLFDLNLLRIDPATMAVELAPKLASGYPELTNVKLRLPREPSLHPDEQALRDHYADCNEKFASQ